MTPFDRLFQRMTQPWLVVSYLVFIVLSVMYLDKPITLFFNGLEYNALNPMLEFISRMALRNQYLVLFVLLALVSRYAIPNRVREKRAWFMWLCVFIPCAIVWILKIMFGRARPELLLHDGVYGFQWFEYARNLWSFPSGHTTTIMGIVWGGWIIWPRARWFLFLFGLAVMLSRIMLFKHYFSDVMMAAYLTLIEVGVLQLLLQRYIPSFMTDVRAHHDKA
jgi:membrane-associated phospholipid phosphatase